MSLRFYVAVSRNGRPIKDSGGSFVVAPEGHRSKKWVFAVARDEGGKVVVLEQVVVLKEAVE